MGKGCCFLCPWPSGVHGAPLGADEELTESHGSGLKGGQDR